MGTSYSAFLEEGTGQSVETNERDWNDFTISEIDSDSDADATQNADNNQSYNIENQTFSTGGSSQREVASNEQQEESQSSQNIESDQSERTIGKEETSEDPQQLQEDSEHSSDDNLDDIPAVPLQEQNAPEDTFEENSGWGPTMGSAAAIIDADEQAPEQANPSDSESSEYELENFFRELGLGEQGGGGTGGRSVVSCMSDQVSTFTDAATAASADNDSFVPQPCRNFEWMGRSLEGLVSGYANVAPILEPLSHTRKKKRGKRTNRRNSKKDNNFLVSESTPTASPLNRKSRQRSLDRCLEPFSSSHHYRESDRNRIDGHRLRKRAGPNVSLNLLARETTGKRIAPNNRTPAPDRLKLVGGSTLYDKLDNPSAGMCSEVTALEEAIDDGDWIKTQTVISRLSPRLIGDPTAAFLNASGGNNNSNNRGTNDPNLPPTAPRFYGGGGRIGLERDAFVLAGGIDVLVRVFREPCFVGTEMAQSYDARDLSKELVATNRLGHSWNECLACLRELVYSIPSLIHTERVFDQGRDDFLPFLFTLLSHDSFFDGAAALIEEILSLQSHSPQPEEHQDQQQTSNSSNGTTNNGCGCDDDDRKTNNESTGDETNAPASHIGPTVRVSPPTTFFLGNVPDLYKLWGGFNCRQLAHFCRILALLIFEPEDRQLLESPAVLKSIELLQLRRNRAARAGRDSTVDMNQSILLGDERILKRFLHLLTVMNFAPPLRCSSPFHIMAHFPYIADTLMMLGLHEFDHWDDIARYERLARKSVSSGESGEGRQLHELGSVARMLESLSDAFLNNEGEPTNQLGHIITVIGAAQQAGVVIGRPRQRATTRMGSRDHSNDEDAPPRRDPSLEGLASAAGILTDQVLLRRTEHSAMQSENLSSLSRVTRPGDAANVMQFNSLLLAPYQVEVLFVLCTLLGGRRKLDTQELLKRSGITTILDDMFQRLPWDSLSPMREPVSHRQNISGGQTQNEDQPGIHGPGCECTPESALCVQYLRLLHNFCDRDCDNYNGRRLLLSSAERKFVFEDCHIGSTPSDISSLSPGLLSKVIAAFMGESDESPYRFWLASCLESYLRGSSSVEQVFVAKTGLVEHLIEDITSQRLHCAGSLQTSFDLLGELCKGNIEVLRLLLGYLDTEEKFRKLMSVAASNLVDSNVFIRSLLLSLERMTYGNEFHDIGNAGDFHITPEWRALNDIHCRGFLTHSWWETQMENPSTCGVLNEDASDGATDNEIRRDQQRVSDWFPIKESFIESQYNLHRHRHDDSFARFGWVYKPETRNDDSLGHTEDCGPNTINRLSWFLTTNRTRLLRDLLEVVNLKNINHENICCLNTAVVITIFANRRNELHDLLEDLKQMDEDENQARLHHSKIPPSAPHGGSHSCQANKRNHCHDILQNFREVLWFWVEYYTHRGRDRLSLEFSSRLRFHEWMEVVTLLAADNGAPTALVRGPLPLPQSPYQRIA